jgi:hypothetical protein
MYCIVVYIPESHLELVKQAMFTQGAGQLGNYSQCCWQVCGQGQFFSESESNPFFGKQNQLSRVTEYRVEMICKPDLLQSVLTAMKAAHPYEEPAFLVIPLQVP